MIKTDELLGIILKNGVVYSSDYLVDGKVEAVWLDGLCWVDVDFLEVRTTKHNASFLIRNLYVTKKETEWAVFCDHPKTIKAPMLKSYDYFRVLDKHFYTERFFNGRYEVILGLIDFMLMVKKINHTNGHSELLLSCDFTEENYLKAATMFYDLWEVVEK